METENEDRFWDLSDDEQENLQQLRKRMMLDFPPAKE